MAKRPTATIVSRYESAAITNITARVNLQASYFEEIESDLSELAPLGCEAEADRDKAKTNDHVPCADT